MATALQSLRMTARCCSCRGFVSKSSSKPIARRRLFSTTSAQYKLDPKFKKLDDEAPDPRLFDEEVDEMLENAGHKYTTLAPPYGFDETARKKLKTTFLNYGDPEPFDEADREDDEDDITSLGHMELEQVREQRHYARLAAWEMPMLSKLAKPFEPPTADTPLRFRYTTYMGEQHPAEKKVVLEFCPEDMPGLTDVQTNKLRKLVGPRLNPETDIVKMSCEMYPSQAQNKRYLGDLVESLLAEAKTGDTFEDIPLDTRHHVFKQKPTFPVEWRLTDKRKEQLEAYRQNLTAKDMQREIEGQLMDGIEIIQKALAKPAAPREALPEMVKAGGKRVAPDHTMSTKIAAFKHTSIEAIPSIAKLCRDTYRTQKTKPIEYRLTQLRKLYWALDDNTDAIVEACKSDLGKPAFETSIAEVDWLKNDIIFVCDNLKKWMKDETAPDMPLMNTLFNPRIKKEPLGSVLVIGAFNFPIQLSLGPLIGAIAAGCTGVLKPSESAPAAAMVMKKIVEDSLDRSAYAVVNGAIPETTALLNEKWDKIFYTGSATVGTIIAKKAAETLTPVCLELGGRNPAIISKNADPALAARRMLWGKTMNAGQICVGQNYMMVEKEILPAFIEQLKIAMKEFYPQGPKASPDFGRIVNNRQFHRIKKMLDNTGGKILIGGDVDEAENYISPTVVLVEDKNDSMLVDESFGPLMPILAVNSLDEAVETANAVHSTPLGFYPFGTKEETDKLLGLVTSGGATVNDAFFHGSMPTLAFGGVGDSGQGSYRGKSSFDCFTHRRSVVSTPNWMEKLLAVRYPPYTPAKLEQFRKTSAKKPNFNREGKEVKGLGYWAAMLFSLGGEGTKSVLARWAVLAFLTYGSKNLWQAKFGNGLPSYLR
ncbi:hypothetical protein CJF30_00001091 [Rutstroemia sp. NJR-2017a BBW]|nr:hypothetical protein CJF30_00001091 [Rutstroemia sp. NJR-2017a BBW]